MIQRLAARVLLLLLSCRLVSPLYCAQFAAESFERSSPAFHPVTPGPDDGRIAFVTAKMLEQYQYLRKRFDESVSSNFFDRYFDALDPQHLHFLQSDLAEFEHYRTNLNRLTVPPPPRPAGDTTPACEIFNRFIKRLSQRVAYAEELLKSERFTFDTDERIVVNRHEAAYPKDLDEARKLWRERLRYEYLQERLGKIGARKKPEPAAAKKETPQTETNALPQAPVPPKEVKQQTLAGKPSDSQPQTTAVQSETSGVELHAQALVESVASPPYC